MRPLQKPIKREVHTRASRRTHRTCIRCKCRDDVLHCVFPQRTAVQAMRHKGKPFYYLTFVYFGPLCSSIFLQ
jgi:hypothetical protein